MWYTVMRWECCGSLALRLPSSRLSLHNLRHAPAWMGSLDVFAQHAVRVLKNEPLNALHGFKLCESHLLIESTASDAASVRAAGASNTGFRPRASVAN